MRESGSPELSAVSFSSLTMYSGTALRGDVANSAGGSDVEERSLRGAGGEWGRVDVRVSIIAVEQGAELFDFGDRHGTTLFEILVAWAFAGSSPDRDPAESAVELLGCARPGAA